MGLEMCNVWQCGFKLAGKVDGMVVGNVNGKVVDKLVGKLDSMLVGKLVGDLVGKVDSGWQSGCWSIEEMERKWLLCPRCAVNRTKEATGKHGRSKHSACCNTACWLPNTQYAAPH